MTRTAGLVLLALLLFPRVEPARGGIVILKSGKVFVGEIRAADVTSAGVTVRWPYKSEERKAGARTFPFAEGPKGIRWFSRTHDLPPDEYWEKYQDLRIEPRWLPLFEKWKLRQEREIDEGYPGFADPLAGLRPVLEQKPVRTAHFRMRAPLGWRSRVGKDGVLRLDATKVRRRGHRARIRAFSVPAVRGIDPEEQVRRILNTLRGVVQGRFGSLDLRHRRSRAHWHDKDIENLSWAPVPSQGKPQYRQIICLRRILFRAERTYFAFAYLWIHDSHHQAPALRRSLRSLRPRE